MVIVTSLAPLKKEKLCRRKRKVFCGNCDFSGSVKERESRQVFVVIVTSLAPLTKEKVGRYLW